MSWVRKTFFRSVLILVSVSLAVAVAEWFYRAKVGTRAEYSVTATGNQYEFYRFDPVLGWANASGAHGTFKRGEFEYAIHVNRHGMRQAEVEMQPAAGRRRIAVVGDSFVWGIGVADEQRFTERLASKLDAVEVLNFGVSGFAPIQHLLDLDRVLAFEPELVVLTFCLGNDFVDNVGPVRYGYAKPYARLDAEGELEVVADRIENNEKFGFEHEPSILGSRLLAALVGWLVTPSARAAEVGESAELVESDMYAAQLDPARSRARDAAVAVNSALLAAIDQRVSAAGAKLLVLPAPSKFEYHPEGTTGHEGYFDATHKRLVDSCRALGIGVLPTLRALHGDDFWKHDGHWNPGGHEKLAEHLAGHLVQQGFVRR